MPMYGILNPNIIDITTLTGDDSELIATFSAPLEISSNQPSFINDTLNLKRKSLYTGIQRWEITAGITPVDTPVNLLTHTILKGYSETFYIRMPQLYRKEELLEPGLTIYSYDNYPIAQEWIPIQGSLLANRLIPAGEFIRFSNHSKVYVVTQSAYIYGVSSIKIAPKLQVAITSSTRVLYDKRVPLRVMYDSNTKLGVSYIDGILVDTVNVTMIEAL